MNDADLELALSNAYVRLHSARSMDCRLFHARAVVDIKRKLGRYPVQEPMSGQMAESLARQEAMASYNEQGVADAPEETT